ncbi:hypothetical protein GCM10007886_18040 [Methylobacterium gregans]|nr:hypothetical protein GCM10007886_18040 [Methylobacterium gregans]
MGATLVDGRLLAKRRVPAYIVVSAPSRNGPSDARRAGLIPIATGSCERATESDASMLDDIYNRRILELAADIPRLGRLDRPDASATAHSKLCGSTVTIDLALDAEDRVADFAHEVRACALGQASSSLMARHVVGASAAELRGLREAVRAMLKQGAAPPDGPWADFAVLEPVRDFKARHASTLLTFDAVVDALDQIAAKRQAA